MSGQQQWILRTDISGMPLEWIHYEAAIKLHYTEQVAYTLGSLLTTVRGGIQARTGHRSQLSLYSILATKSARHYLFHDYQPPLSNPALFRRDDHICLYCGQQFPVRLLSRDHVVPISRQGRDVWTNVVTACKSCNNKKANRTPEQAKMPLLAVPFQPTYAEYVYLQGRNILADQMDFLRSHFPRNSPLRLRE